MNSYIIATRREDLKELKRLILSLRPFLKEGDEVLCILDGGKLIKTEELPAGKVITKRHEGVGAAFDFGVSKAKNENIVLLGSDVIFKTDPSKHFEKAIDDKAITCFACKVHKGSATFYGANIKETSGGRIYQAGWRRKKTGSLHQIGCILGAAYLVTKSWYHKIGGFNGHKHWGSLEPLISLRSYMAGGSCKVYSDYVIEHDFSRSNTKALKLPLSMIYNQLLIDSYFKKSKMNKITNYSWLVEKALKKLPEVKKYKLTAETAFTKMKSKQ